jgi:hypothetical protein
VDYSRSSFRSRTSFPPGSPTRTRTSSKPFSSKKFPSPQAHLEKKINRPKDKEKRRRKQYKPLSTSKAAVRVYRSKRKTTSKPLDASGKWR